MSWQQYTEIISYSHFNFFKFIVITIHRTLLHLINMFQGYFFGYDENIDATISNEFAVAALRFGHTLVTSPLTRQSRSWGTQTPNMVLKNRYSLSIFSNTGSNFGNTFDKYS